MDRASTKHRMFTNAGFSFFSYVLPIFFSIIITPIIVLKLGVGQYGLLMFITAVSGLIGIVGSGAEASAIRHLSYYHSRGEEGNVKKVTGTMNATFLVIAIIGAAIILGGFIFGFKIMPRSSSFSYSELLILFEIVSLQFFIQTALRFYMTIPSALQRFDINSSLSMISLTVTSIGNLILVLNNFGIQALLVFQFIWSLIILSAWIAISKHLLPSASYTIRMSIVELKNYFRFGSLASINEFARTSLFSLDRILIPMWGGGVSLLSYYTVPGNLTARIPGVADNLSGIMFPAASSLHSVGQNEKLKVLYVRSTRLISLLSVAITVAIIFNAEKIMRFWLDENFAIYSTKVLIILAVTNLVLSLLSPVASFFMGMNKMKFNTVLSFSMAGINIIALAVLIPRFGITGAAWAYLLSVLPIFYAIYFIEKKYLDLRGRKIYYIKLLLKHLVVISITAFTIVLILNPLIVNFLTLAIIGPICVLLYLLVFILLGFLDKEDYHDVINFVGSLFLKTKKNVQDQA